MAAKKHIDWDRQPLGVVPDKVLAERLGVTMVAVCAARRVRGILPYRNPDKPVTKRVNWDRQPLGEMRDCELANELGVSHTRVRQARVLRGIPRVGPPRKKNAATNLIDWSAQPLGLEPDRVIAQRLGVSHGVVMHRRQALGIAPCRKGEWWDSQPLGLVPDTVIVGPRGMHRSAAFLARKARGIPAYEETIEFDGQAMNLWQWAARLGLDYYLLWSRLSHGWSVDRAFRTPSGGDDMNMGLQRAADVLRRRLQRRFKEK